MSHSQDAPREPWVTLEQRDLDNVVAEAVAQARAEEREKCIKFKCQTVRNEERERVSKVIAQVRAEAGRSRIQWDQGWRAACDAIEAALGGGDGTA